MQEVYSIPFISNTIPSMAAAKRDPEMLSFLETMRFAALRSNFIFLRSKDRDQFSHLGYRADKHVESSVEFLRQIRRYHYGIIHLHLSSHKDASFAVPLIGSSVSSPDYQVYVSGVNFLEKKKLQATLDPSFKRLPSGFHDGDAIDILVNFNKVFYLEHFRQSIQDIPTFSDRQKDEYISIAQRASLFNRRNGKLTADYIKLINVNLISEYWNKYSNLYLQITTFLGQSENQNKLYSAKLLLSRMISEARWVRIKTDIFKHLPFEYQETIGKVKNKTDFIDYIATVLLNLRNDERHHKICNILYKHLLVQSLQTDSAIFKKIKFIDQESKADNYLSQQLTSFVTNFNKLISVKDDNSSDKEQIPDEAKKLYTAEMVGLLGHSLGVGITGNLSTYEYDNYRISVGNFLKSDIYSVDKMVITPLMKDSKNMGFLISKLLPKITINKITACNIVDDILKYINPYFQFFKDLHDIAEARQVGEVAKDMQKQQVAYSKKIINILPRLDYLLCVESASAIEKSIFIDAKRAIGMQVFPTDYQTLDDYRHKAGYSQIVVPHVHTLHPLKLDPGWLYDAYTYFIKYQVHRHLSQLLSSKPDFLKKGEVNRYNYFIQYLLDKSIYLGYEQLKKILLSYKKWDIHNLVEFGYETNILPSVDYYNHLLDYDNWLPKNQKEVDKKSVILPLIDDKNSLHNYFNQQYANWQDELGKRTDVRSTRKTDKWITAFFQNLINGNVHDIFSEDARRLLPINNWQSELQSKIQEHFKNNFSQLKILPEYILIRLTTDQSFIRYFCFNFLIELGDNMIPIIFYTSNADLAKYNWKWNNLIESLKQECPNLINSLRHAWRRICTYQTIYLRLVHGASLILLGDVMQRYLQQDDQEEKGLTKFRRTLDKSKLIICEGDSKEDGKKVLNRIKDKGVTIALNEALERFYSFYKADERKDRLTTMLAEINHQMAAIPYIKYAPYNIKRFRFNISKIEDILSAKISELDDFKLKEVLNTTEEVWGVYTKLIEDEVSYPYKYRYLHIAFNNAYIKINNIDRGELLDFLSAGSNSSRTKKAGHGFLLNQLREAILFKDVLSDKKLFFIYAGQSRSTELGYLLESLRIVKGLEAEIYVDNRDIDDDLRKHLLLYISPSNIISLH
ncbi:MAG: hypothetical protein JJV97_02515 [SAR324 cluster bacterium]|nr:hypothetical protein [SAR324 cluster bacterium]